MRDASVETAAVFAAAFDAWHAVMKVILALFVLNTTGYFIGDLSEGALMKVHKTTAMLSWGSSSGRRMNGGKNSPIGMPTSDANPSNAPAVTASTPLSRSIEGSHASIA